MSDERQRFVEGFASHWSDPSPTGFSVLFTPEVRLVAPLLPVTNGIPAAERAFARIFRVFKDMRGEVHDWAPHAEGVFIDFTLSAMLGGRPVSWRGIDRFLLRDGQALERVHFFDTRPLMQQTLRLPRAWLGLARAGARPRPPYLERSGGADAPGEPPPLVRACSDLWRAPSAEGVAVLLGTHGRYLIPGLPAITADIVGRRRAEHLFALLPDLEGEVIRWGAGENSLFVESHVRATIGRKLMRWPQVDRLELTDGRIAAIEAFLDTFPLAARIRRSGRQRRDLHALLSSAC
jgi:ketosteroid isomerase-like protein